MSENVLNEVLVSGEDETEDDVNCTNPEAVGLINNIINAETLVSNFQP